MKTKILYFLKIILKIIKKILINYLIFLLYLFIFYSFGLIDFNIESNLDNIQNLQYVNNYYDNFKHLNNKFNLSKFLNYYNLNYLNNYFNNNLFIKNILPNYYKDLYLDELNNKKYLIDELYKILD